MEPFFTKKVNISNTIELIDKSCWVIINLRLNKMKISSTKISIMTVFFILYLCLFTILEIPHCEYGCNMETSPVPDNNLKQTCCVNTVENSSTNNELIGDVLIPYEHNNCDCENSLEFICFTDKHKELIISTDLQKKFFKPPFLYYENATSDFIVKESFSLLCSPQVNSTHFPIRSVVLLI